ncbi:C-terminal binding protein [Arthrobacter sp. UYEF36]|uniref:C-terminal binding protein n=1 Tax=Arthrobacter sp. UYEF36 TaxID=1756366 RepID=UPI00339827EF
MTRPVAVYTDLVETDPQPGIDELEAAGFEVRVADSVDPEVITALASDADALLIGYSPIDRTLISRLGNLKIIATQSVGFDMVDAQAAAEQGIWLANVPGAATEEVATHAFAMAMAMLRGLPFLDRAVRSGVWDGTRERLRRPSEVTVGVLGLGRIGSRFAALARPVVGRVVGYDPFQAGPDDIERLDLNEILEVSEVVSLHLPLTQGTQRILDGPRLALLPDGAFIINVSRGGLIDHDALLEMLDTGRLGGAGLDVLPHEPPRPQDRILGHPRVLLSPHAAYLSAATQRDYVLHQARNVIRWHAEGTPDSPVNIPAPLTTI